MKSDQRVNFKEIDWKAVDEKKAGFLYGEALGYSNGLLADIRALNSKAFQLLAFVLPLFCAAIGFLMAARGNEGMDGFILPAVVACGGLFAVLALLLVAVFPRHVYLSESPPASYFSKAFYKEDMLGIFSFAIASVSKYIHRNYRVMRFRGRFLAAAIIALMAMPLATLAAFLLCLPNS